jgi:hypothetical protein
MSFCFLVLLKSLCFLARVTANLSMHPRTRIPRAAMLITTHILRVSSALVFHPVAPLDHQRLCSDVAPSWSVDTTRVALHQVFPHNNRT